MSGLCAGSDWFRRFVLPGFAFKALVIGGGYATGRELAEFFLPSGAWGGLAAMLLAAALWSGIAALTFRFSRHTRSLDYRAFFQALLGPVWFLFEIAFILLLIILLAVFGAAAGAIGATLLGAPPLAGTIALVVLIAAFATFGNHSVEGLFKYVSLLLYGVYALFLVIALTRFGDRIVVAFVPAPLHAGWVAGGVTYAAYNVVGATSILTVLRHARSERDVVIAGLLAGPLAMLPAILFYVCMVAWPEAGNSALPSDYLLSKLDLPWLRVLYQGMIFAALLECGTGAVHAFNQRIAGVFEARSGVLSTGRRLAISLLLLTVAVFLADRIGLVKLIAEGYRYLAYAFLAVYVAPLLTVGVWRLGRPWMAAGHGSQATGAGPVAVGKEEGA
jgi:uncharacterized membrane protein YkvI